MVVVAKKNLVTVATAVAVAVAFIFPIPISSVSSTKLDPLPSQLLPPSSGIKTATSLSTSGGLDEFNKMFENASILIPERFEVSEEVAFVDLNMDIRNIECYDMAIGNIIVDHEQRSSTNYLVTVGIANLDVTCEMDYSYTYGVLSGDGWVQIQTEKSDITSTISFTSLDFGREYPPNDSAVIGCFSDVEIKYIDFEEDFASEVLEVFQSLIRNTVEVAIGDVACAELSVVGTNIVGNMVDMAAEKLEPYLGNLGADVTDPLSLEQKLVLPEDLKPLNLQDTEGHVGKTFDEILQYFDTYLGVPISSSPHRGTRYVSTGTDLVINSLLRSFFLDDDGSLPIDPASIPSLTDQVLFEGHDRVTEFTIALKEVRLYGLDTMTRFNSFRKIGKHTIQNELTWDSFTFEFDITLSMKPSTLDDAILIDPTSPGISEDFTIDFKVDNVDVEASLLIVLDEDAMGSMELGPLLHTENLLPCMLSIVQEVKLSGLDVDPSYINYGPTMNGFLSSGLDRVISDSIEAAYAMYKGSLRTAIPNIFQTDVRELINTFLVDTYFGNKTNSGCPKAQPSQDKFLDFRKFSTGDSSGYGDVIPMLKNIMDDKLLAVEGKTGRPRINEALIAPFTGAQSGTKGTMSFPMDLLSVLLSKTTSQQFGMESLELRVFDPKIENMDTVGSPIKLLEPNSTSGQILDNYATFGDVSRKLRIGLKGLIAADGDPTFAMTNEMDLSVELAGSDAWISLLANVDAATFFNFPIRDVTNLQCWLNTLATPVTINEREDTGFSILNALLTTKALNFNISCVSCTSPSLAFLPEVLESLEDFGVSNVLETRLIALVLDLLQSDYTQGYINGILMDSALRCPHSPKYIGPSASFSDNPTLGFPSLGYKSLETIVFASIVVTEIAAVVMAKAHESYELESSFPLSAQYDLVVPKDVRLIDFTSLDVSVGEWASSGLKNFVSFMNEVVHDANEQSDKSGLRVNKFIRSALLDENESVSMVFDDLNITKYGMGISLKELKIFGLDTISEFSIIDAIGAQTIQNRVSWTDVRLQLVVSLIDQSSDSTWKRDIAISADLSDVTLSVAILMAMDLDLLDSVEMWSIMEMKKIIPCLMSAAYDATFTELELSIGAITEFTIDGFDSSEITAAASESSRLILEKYGDEIISSIPKFFDSTVRTLLNNWLQYYMDDLPHDRCKYRSSKNSGLVDLRDLFWTTSIASQLGGSGLSQYGDMFRTAMGFVQDAFKIDESTGLSGFNDVVVDPLTQLKDDTTGTMSYSGDLLNRKKKIHVGALDTNVQFRVYDAKVEKLNTVGAPLELFGGVMGEAFLLNNTITAGVGEHPVRFSSKLLLSLQGDDNIEISNEVDLSLELTNANVIVSTMTKIAESSLLGFPLRNIFDLNCWLATIPAPTLDPRGVRVDGSEVTASLSAMKASIGKLVVAADCVNCSSPRMTEFTELLSAPAARNETTDVANALLDYLTELMGGNFLQVQIDRVLNDAARKCPHSPTYDPNAKPIVYDAFEAPDSSYSLGNLVLLGALALGAIIVLSIIVVGVKCIVRRRHSKWLMKLPPHQIKMLSDQQRSDMDLEEKLNTTTKSMFRSTNIPWIVRVMMPTIILSNIALFLSGHLSLGATVNIEAEIAGEKFTVEKFFEFSMARSTVDIWRAGGRELATLIFIFSGIWPYSKLLISFWLWFCSPSTVSISRRGSILIWLDWLAKWSMIDIFVLVISIAAFRISIESPDTSYLPNNFYTIEMMVIPLWGLYANMIAQLLSQVTSHIFIHYHRLIVTEGTDNLKQYYTRKVLTIGSAETGSETQDPEAPFDHIFVGASNANPTLKVGSEEKMSLSTHKFSRPHRGETEKLFVRSYVNSILPLCGLSLVIFIAMGCILPSFTLELFGLVGVAVEFGRDFEEATINHSVFSVIKLLFDQASYLGSTKDYIGLIVLSILFVSTILFVPIIQTITILCQWFFSSTITQKRKIAVRLEILQAWQYLEVYLVALFVSSWQLGPVSDFMINAYCKNLEDTFAQMIYFGVLKENDAQCFSVTSHINNNVFFLVAGAILLSFLSSFVLKATFQYFRDERDLDKSVKGADDSVFSSLDRESRYDDIDTEIVTNIRPVPVLFTDSFRWLLRATNTIALSSRTLSADSENDHWVLPEATVVADADIPTNSRTVKGTYVSNLSPEGKIDLEPTGDFPKRRRRRFRDDGSTTSTTSNGSYQPSPKGKVLNYDGRDEKHSYRGSPRQQQRNNERRDSSSSHGRQSISSQIDSMENTSKSEPFKIVSPGNSIGSAGSSVQSPPSKARTSPRSCGSLRKAPPPSEYRLSRELEKSSRSRAPAIDNGLVERSPGNLKEPPLHSFAPDRSNGNKRRPSADLPSSPRSVSSYDGNARFSIQNEYYEATFSTDEEGDDEYRRAKSINDIIKEVDDDDDDFLQFEDISFSQDSASPRDWI
mmetsp:Transcript_5265/g.15313  ORF Transcript_5265/g.15313 Transcript_5265/m.15313 type:complete len:2439 (+) Transcript_5265:618-7934(+)|eukprot:CAMPEP_0172371330 /NCGR_PEP_ID=MMETSP1060-20121228/42244_1 /TAXON_ID=37318 /ORGANISM="Pseudo-nitzschia pungens, Strain cf. cingulata" /LENGTH=2438 /DNA_ID=CAMNT_0013096915 /DNA_START=560 /DNA_END=7876 /DNA_ORIENTATION=+